MPKPEFDDLTDVYEVMIDWPKRLANEEPFYRHWFARIAVRRLLDVACGTGHHAAMFRDWGLMVEGADLSPAMIARARANFGESERLRWTVRGFDQPITREGEAPAEPPGATAGLSSSETGIAGKAQPEDGTAGQASSGTTQPFDATICTGNSLALAPDLRTVDCAIRQMFAAVRPGGLVIVQVLNLWQYPDGPCVWQKCKKARIRHPASFSPEPTATAGAEDAKNTKYKESLETHAVAVGSGLNERSESDVLILKGVHRSATRGYVEFLTASLTDAKLLHHESVSFLGLEASDLENSARRAGATAVHFFGDYKQHPYNREKSPDLIMVAELEDLAR
jgi:SAM-dependent methyltransferase